LPGVPFHESWGVILNEHGRVIDSESRQPIPGLYTAGWIKRGPSGVIGTNKPDSVETANCMLEDRQVGKVFSPSQPDRDAFLTFIRQRQPRFVSYAEWLKLDALEIQRGAERGSPRLKFTRVEDMLTALGK
jgi:ferredoxin--NADP+ reductase